MELSTLLKEHLESLSQPAECPSVLALRYLGTQESFALEERFQAFHEACSDTQVSSCNEYSGMEHVVRMVDAETMAWNSLDAEKLVDLWHDDFYMIWPPSNAHHDPTTWDVGMGRFDREKWQSSWQELMDTHNLIRNDRIIRKVKSDPSGLGGFAVVDIDTVWKLHNQEENVQQWKGRTCKVYTQLKTAQDSKATADDEKPSWKLIQHYGVLSFDDDGNPISNVGIDVNSRSSNIDGFMVSTNP